MTTTAKPRYPLWHQVYSLKDLASLAGRGTDQGEFAIMLNHGAYSVKTISIEPSTGRVWVWNHIDDSEQTFADIVKLINSKRSNIGQAYAQRALYYRSI